MHDVPCRDTFHLVAIGYVETPFLQLGDAPMQGKDAMLSGTIILRPAYAEGIKGVARGDRLLVLLWFHLGQRDVFRVHPRGDETQRLKGVFLTRSPHRPNPIALCEVEVESVSATRIQVRGLDAIDGTPVIDIKPVLT
jgi:tRNA-Thr(GGU) m(6)t(6)A37 methyltransferase TsaA